MKCLTIVKEDLSITRSVFEDAEMLPYGEE